jgi:hypothetical protein
MLRTKLVRTKLVGTKLVRTKMVRTKMVRTKLLLLGIAMRKPNDLFLQKRLLKKQLPERFL